MPGFLRQLAAPALVLGSCLPVARAASLTVRPLPLVAGETSTVFVYGVVENESTFGVTVLLELVPLPGSKGTVTFTPAPPTDVLMAGDPWPGVGMFTPFDTDASGSLFQNGAVNDNGTFIPQSVAYDGPLASFPVVVSMDAAGFWSVLLSTSRGESRWEGLATNLTPGIIEVQGVVEVPVVSDRSLVVMILGIATAGAILFHGLYRGPFLVPRSRSSLTERNW